ncbi:MAG: MBL fold metallo-hydrolase [Gemmatimonadetes bacterium]|nr:MBL fold metallo-hydrolase [Gemmatimonadota bacterium]NNF13854.1 MBL fold metallo-hydrolase [Gemmatimonadota bacterium]NNL31323.1 MBL fold metallo-hydrolase [Gemmatimonadota bacterium]
MGRRRIAIIDPGPDVDSHVRALASLGARADSVTLLLTHGHDDHVAAAPRLAAELDAEVFGPKGLEGLTSPLDEGDSVATDAGVLVALHTPGHTREHLAFHWLERRAAFVGDHLLGRGDTTWVAEYPGCVQDYLDSLARLDSLDVDVLYPAHGPPLEDPREAVARFRHHRLERIDQVRRARASHPEADSERLVDIVYGGTVPASMHGAARKSLEAVLDHLDAHG